MGQNSMYKYYGKTPRFARTRNKLPGKARQDDDDDDGDGDDDFEIKSS